MILPRTKLTKPLISLRALTLIVCIFLPLSVFAQKEEILSDLNEEIVQIPMVVDGFWGKKEIQLTATTFHPQGHGPFPLIILSHGNPPNAADRPKIGRYRMIPQIREFLKRGFAVIVPIRRGYGKTGGTYAEDYGSCSAPFYYDAGLEAAKDLLATLTYASNLPYIRSDKILLIGHSAGGFASIATASLNPPGVVGVVNFAGGRGGNPATSPGNPCGPERMAETIGKFAKTTKVPFLWFYTENDLFFGPQVVRTWFAAFQNAGAKGRLVIQPPFGKDGHSLFSSRSGIPIWTPEFDRFLMELGMGEQIKNKLISYLLLRVPSSSLSTISLQV